MKKNVFSLMLLACFAFMGVAKAQEEIKVTVNTDVNATISDLRVPVVLTYAPEPMTPAGFLSIGMAFSWGYMFPAEMIAEYDGKYLTQVAYVDYTNSAGDYEVHIWQGGDTAPATEIARQAFTISGTVNNIVPLPLDQPALIDGSQNLWVTFYQDGSVQQAACVITDMGDPNSRWIGVDGYGWMDMASVQGGAGYSFALWAFADDYDAIGEFDSNVAVYPNPTTSNVTVAAPGMNHITVFNAMGQMVMDMPVSNNSQVLDMSQYQAGVYMVRVASEKGISTKRVTVM